MESPEKVKTYMLEITKRENEPDPCVKLVPHEYGGWVDLEDHKRILTAERRESQRLQKRVEELERERNGEGDYANELKKELTAAREDAKNARLHLKCGYESENKALREENHRLKLAEGKTMVNCNHWGEGFIPKSEVEKLRADAGRYREALEKYSRHEPDCYRNTSEHESVLCDCGLDEALKEPQ